VASSLPFDVVVEILRFELFPLADQYIAQPAAVDFGEQG
jgi:hypothetical protein